MHCKYDALTLCKKSYQTILNNYDIIKLWKTWDNWKRSKKFRHFVPCQSNAVSICTRILKYWVWKIEFDELDFLFISNLNFAGYTGSKNLVQTRQKFQFIKLDFSNSIFQNPSTDRYWARILGRKRSLSTSRSSRGI